MPTRFDVLVVGAGHAGIEAALAAARMGCRTACVTLDLGRIGHLPCNCSIGGPAKGHLAREVDALGGAMGVTTDYALTHIRRVGTGKGPAVQTVRAHVCKTLYPRLMRQALLEQEGLELIEGTVEAGLVRNGTIVGARLRLAGSSEWLDLEAASLVLTTGTFLNGLCHRGREQTVAARFGDQAVQGISRFLEDLGIRLRRFKTGTTPRVSLRSLEMDGLPRLESEPEAGAVSFLHSRPHPASDLYDCWQTSTNPGTHAALAGRLSESAMYSGQIQGVGPRYCPSIEDKIVKFADKESHPIFLEIEEWHGDSVYVQGFSSSLPADAQLQALRTVPGLESAEVIRYGYAVEYDMADPLQLNPTFASKLCDGLFLAGQVNGTSGYEEAAAQGILAGINAARWAQNREPVEIRRDQAFLGVLADDLTTKGVDDPYRMLTARAEHRLMLRHDNADQRLTPLARELSLCSESRWERFQRKMDRLSARESLWRQTVVSARHNPLLAEIGLQPVDNAGTLFDLLRRPDARLAEVQSLADRMGVEPPSDDDPELDSEADAQVELNAKYEGYLAIQERSAARQRKLDDIRIPAGTDFASMRGLSYESIEKLTEVRPSTVGQASRLPGMRPSDVALLIGWLRGGRCEAAGN